MFQIRKTEKKTMYKLHRLLYFLHIIKILYFLSPYSGKAWSLKTQRFTERITLSLGMIIIAFYTVRFVLEWWSTLVCAVNFPYTVIWLSKIQYMCLVTTTYPYSKLIYVNIKYFFLKHLEYFKHSMKSWWRLSLSLINNKCEKCSK